MKFGEAFYENLEGKIFDNKVDLYFQKLFIKYKSHFVEVLDAQYSWLKKSKCEREIMGVFQKSFRQTDHISKVQMKQLTSSDLDEVTQVIFELKNAPQSRSMWYNDKMISDDYLIIDNLFYNYMHYSETMDDMFLETIDNIPLLKEFEKVSKVG